MSSRFSAIEKVGYVLAGYLLMHAFLLSALSLLNGRLYPFEPADFMQTAAYGVWVPIKVFFSNVHIFITEIAAFGPLAFIKPYSQFGFVALEFALLFVFLAFSIYWFEKRSHAKRDTVLFYLFIPSAIWILGGFLIALI